MVQFPGKPVLLDGGLGRELRFRGVAVPTTIWSAAALMSAPGVVRQIHLDYIAAGADIITANTYGVIRDDLAKVGIEDRFAELNTLACDLAVQARDASSRQVVIAGSLPPLGGSFRPDRVGSSDIIETLYGEQAELLAPHVHEDRSGNLRSGESIKDAAQALQDLPVQGLLVNCCAPESVTRAMPFLAATGTEWIGGYANTFAPIPQDWELDGAKDTDGLLTLRSDLDPHRYAVHVTQWLERGATVVGGCCGTRPSHITIIRSIIDKMLTV